MNTIYVRIAMDIEKSIQVGDYQLHKKLPSVRDLSEKYSCSQGTVIKAYETLKNKHLIYSLPQSGYYIVENVIKTENIDTAVVDFSTGNLLMRDMHIPDLNHCLNRATDIYQDLSLSHTVYGVESLRKLSVKYLADFQVFTPMNNVFINLGIQPALSILAQMPFPNGKNAILIEQPTYKYFIDFLKFSGAQVLGIRRDEQGIDLNRLEELFKKEPIKFFYTVPRNHNPLGTTYPKTQRKAIAELAARYDVYIVEDDYFGDISFDPKYDPIYAYGDHRHHIYLKNFSKILPWIRVGIVVIPTDLLNIFTEHTRFSYYYSYFSASLISQATLEIYIRSNILKKHVQSIKKELSERLKCLDNNFRNLATYNIKCIGGKTGYYSYLKLPDYMNENQFIENLKKRHIRIAGGSNYSFYIDNSWREKGIRLSIARTNKAAINKGFEIIYEELKRR
ncbi:MAG: transcriptional regulator, GntR family with aminotransferase domain containing protein [Firmicutes bacterium]|nr:transcriptional regulator, GntR family with aminotransferase domain containing protein [Bacillota bacterium]